MLENYKFKFNNMRLRFFKNNNHKIKNSKKKLMKRLTKFKVGLCKCNKNM